MNSDADANDADYKSRRVCLWTAKYSQKFSKLLLENTVVLQNTQNYYKDDPVHLLKKQAMEHLQAQLNLKSIEEVRSQITRFKKFASNKLRSCAAKSPGSAPAEILRSAPAWLRELEPHINMWTRAMHKKKPRVSKPPAKPVDRVTALALELVKAAHSARSLDARVVCSKVQVQDLPGDKTEELQFVWWRMLDIVRQKLALIRDAGDNAEDACGSRFSTVESLLADLLILFDDTICTVCEYGDYESMQAQVSLFHLAQLHRLEEAAPSPARARWKRAHEAYRATVSPRVGSVSSSITLMQRRWHEMKLAARRAIAEYVKGSGPPPSPLYAALAKRFPHIVTKPIAPWRELVDSGTIIEDESQVSDVDEEPAEMPEVDRLNILTAREVASYERCEPFQRYAARRALRSLSLRDALRDTAKEDEDDIILIEKEIETIDLVAADEGEAPAGGPLDNYAYDDNMESQLRMKRKNFADQLEEELERQLRDMEGGGEAAALLAGAAPAGDPVLIYDSEDDIMECHEDRRRNIEMIAAQIGSERETAHDVMKEEVLNKVTTDVTAASSTADVTAASTSGDVTAASSTGDVTATSTSGDVTAASSTGDVIAPSSTGGVTEERNTTDDENIKEDSESLFDEKLLMATEISLVRVSDTPEWKKFAKKRKSSVDVNKLNLALFAPKRARAGAPAGLLPPSPHPPHADLPVKVKMEKIDDSPGRPGGERQVKILAKQLISEVMRDELEEGGAAPNDTRNRLTKKVHLPNIEEVRRNNKSMLMAEVAPLSTDFDTKNEKAESAETAENTAEDSTRLSTDSSDALQIDESSRESTDTNISRNQLDRILNMLAVERGSRRAGGRGAGAGGGAGGAHCCLARRQRALNGARRRIALRKRRPPPPAIDIHSRSRCANGCNCCCKHLLTERVAGAKLQREAREVEAALGRLLGGPAGGPETGSSESNTNKAKKIRQKKPAETAVETVQDPLQEWIRQKNLNSQYFNLNLKARPPDERRKLLVPTTSSTTDSKPAYIKNVPLANLVKSSLNETDTTPTNVYTQSNTSQSVSTTIAVPKIKVPCSLIGRRVLHTSLHNVVKSSLKSGPGTLLKLAPATNNQSTTPAPVSSYATSGTFIRFARGVNTSSSTCIPQSTTSPTPENPVVSVARAPRVRLRLNGQPVTLEQDLPATERKKKIRQRPHLQASKNYSSASVAANPPSDVTRATGASQASDVSDVSDVTQAIVGNQASDGKQVIRVTRAIFANHASDVTRASDVSQASDVTRASDVSQSTLANQASDVTQAILASDVSQAVVANQTSDVTQTIVTSGATDVSQASGVSQVSHLTDVTSLTDQTKDYNLAKVKMGEKQLVVRIQKLDERAPDLDAEIVGTKVYKMSSKSSPSGLPVPTEPRSLLKDPLEVPQPIKRVVLYSKDGIRTTKEIHIVPKKLVTPPSDIKPLQLKRSTRSKCQGATPPRLPHPGSSNDTRINPGNTDDAFASPILDNSAGLTPLGASDSSPALEGSHAGGVVVGGDGASAADSTGGTSDFDSLLTTESEMLHPEKYYKRRDLTIDVETFLQSQDLSNIFVQCFGEHLFTVLDSYYILAEEDAAEPSPAYWTLAAVPHSRRLLLGEEGAPLASSYKMCVDRKVFLKLQENPLVYARVVRALGSAAECLAALRAGATLRICHAASGRLAALARDRSLPHALHLISPELDAVTALAEALNKLERPAATPAAPAAPAATPAAPAVRTHVNARADVAMMINNVKRRPIEIVHVDSDEEGKQQTAGRRFKGLEVFEDLDDFEL